MQERSIRQPARLPAVNMKELIIAAIAAYTPVWCRTAIHIGIMDQYTVTDTQKKSCQTEKGAARGMDAIVVRKRAAHTARSTAEEAALHLQQKRRDRRIQAHIRIATAPRKRGKLTPTTYTITNLLRTSPMTSKKSFTIMRTTTKTKMRLMMRQRTIGESIIRSNGIGDNC